jgi:putative DNA primase/helicase
MEDRTLILNEDSILDYESPLNKVFTSETREKSAVDQTLIGLTGGPVKKDYTDTLIEEHQIKTMEDNNDMWRYDREKGIFVPGAEPIIKARIELDNKGKVKNRDVNEYIGQIQRRSYTNRDDFDPDISWIAATNCMVNLRTGETRPFDPWFMCTMQLPVKSNSTSGIMDFFDRVEGPVFGYGFNHCPAITKFLYEIMSREDVELLLDFLAYCLWRDYKFNVWMLFNGAGQNGKSTLLNLIEKFFGSENVSGESLERLLKDRFAPANLYQKMVNLDADLSPDILLRNTGKLKKLTGNDQYPAEIKYMTSFKFRNYAKLIFSCNKIPESDDMTDAFFRRLIIINFKRQFFGAKEDINLIDKLTTPEELSGLFHILVNRLPKVLENGIRQTTSELMEKTYDKYVRGSNPVEYFVKKALVLDSTARVKKLNLYDAYERFCQEFGLPPESEQSFSRKMSKDFGFNCKQYRDKGEKPYFWIGIRLKTHDEIDEQSRLEEIGEYSSVTQEAMK